MVRARIEYYGVLESVCGMRCEDVDFEANAPLCVEEALAQLFDRHRGLAEHRKHIACALDNELSRGDAIVRDGSVLALLPPVSGG